MDFRWSVVFETLPTLISVAKINIMIAVSAFALAFAFGTVVALLRLVRFWPLVFVLNVYISFIRGTPVLVQVFIVYYVIPTIGIDLPPLAAGIVALALNSAAFVAEIVRAGIASVAKGQHDASAALGLRTWQTWGLVVLPQAFRTMMPAFMNEFTIVLKGTPIVSVITVVEVLRTSELIIDQNFRPFETLIAASIVFFVINFAVGLLFSHSERRGAVRAH